MRLFDDGIGEFRDKSRADGFLNFLISLTDDLQYTIEYPSHDGSLPYMDILIHADKSKSVNRKPTHTNLYVRYNSCAPWSSKDGVIRSLTRRAHILCSPQHLQKELDTVYTTSLQHESNSRLHLLNPDDFSHNQYAPAHHSQTTGHKISCDRTTILTTTRYKTQLDLTEHTAIKTRDPLLNRTDSAP